GNVPSTAPYTAMPSANPSCSAVLLTPEATPTRDGATSTASEPSAGRAIPQPKPVTIMPATRWPQPVPVVIPSMSSSPAPISASAALTLTRGGIRSSTAPTTAPAIMIGTTIGRNDSPARTTPNPSWSWKYTDRY